MIINALTINTPVIPLAFPTADTLMSNQMQTDNELQNFCNMLFQAMAENPLTLMKTPAKDVQESVTAENLQEPAEISEDKSEDCIDETEYELIGFTAIAANNIKTEIRFIRSEANTEIKQIESGNAVKLQIQSMNKSGYVNEKQTINAEIDTENTVAEQNNVPELKHTDIPKETNVLFQTTYKQQLNKTDIKTDIEIIGFTADSKQFEKITEVNISDVTQKSSKLTKPEKLPEIRARSEVKNTDDVIQLRQSVEFRKTLDIQLDKPDAIKLETAEIDLVPQLTNAIRREAVKEEGISTFKLKLKPEGLGEVTVHLSREQGKLEVMLKTELSQTKELITRGIDSLKVNLQNSVNTKNDISISISVEYEASNFDAMFAGGNQGRNQTEYKNKEVNYSGIDSETEKRTVFSNKSVYIKGSIDYKI
ncbi:MAG: hypothetical protein A2Y17_04365 [Clostridiales bacterium GWF2_38_85]|nr:MAG: hypothetical protein A2Y17_04365 [Clostridiales bacterium GWF2_38_85]